MLQPSTIVATLALKLYLGHMRNQDRISRILKINERNIGCQCGHNSNILEVKRSMKPKCIAWNDEIAWTLESRNITIVNYDENQSFSTRNKTVIDIVYKHITTKKLNNNLHAILNQVRVFKKINLPCELVGLTRTLETTAAINNDDISCFTRIEKHPKVPKPSRKSFEDWNGFLE